MINKDLKKRILEISYKNKLSHLGSCLTAVDIINEIFKIKKKDEKFVLSSGHAGLALYCVLEKYSADATGLSNGLEAEAIFKHHGVHPDLCNRCGIDCSSGSLGHGLPIALGFALADPTKNVYCLISDGECSEGSIWEALTIKQKYHVDNLKVYVNYNGWGAYDSIPMWGLSYRLRAFDIPLSNIIMTNFNDFPFLKGQDAHYVVMGDEQYKQGTEILK